MKAEKSINTNDLHSNVKKLKTAKHGDLKDALCTWMQQMSAKIATKTGDIIREQVKVFGQKNEHQNFRTILPNKKCENSAPCNACHVT